MLKKTLLTITLFALVGIISAQTLQFEHEGVIYESGQTIICTFDESLYEYVHHMQIRNLSDQELNVIVEQNVIEPAEGALVSLCWGQCFAPGNNIVSNPVAIPAQTLSDEDLSFHVMFTEGETGVVKAIYHAYDESNPDSKINLIVLAGATADVKENTLSLSQAYPNPASSQVHFDFKANGNADIQVVVYNLLGQEVNSQAVNGAQGRIDITVDQLQAGIYFCRFLVNNEVVRTEKFIVKR